MSNFFEKNKQKSMYSAPLVTSYNNQIALDTIKEYFRQKKILLENITLKNSV